MGRADAAIRITPLVSGSGSVEIIVRAEDDPQDLAKPRGSTLKRTLTNPDSRCILRLACEHDLS